MPEVIFLTACLNPRPRDESTAIRLEMSHVLSPGAPISAAESKCGFMTNHIISYLQIKY